MAEHIYKCKKCKKYSMYKKCPTCNTDTESPRPPKFSLNDKYSSYRRDVKKKELVKKKLY